MKRFILAVSIPFFSSSLLAQALFKGEAAPVTPHNWTGYYGGINIGGVKNTMDITDNQATSFNATLQQTMNPQPTAGLQIGYRRQLDPTKTSGVFGIELSANVANATFDKNYGSPFALYQLESKHTLENYCLLQLMGGIAADRTLFFLVGGLSWTNISGNTTSTNAVPFFNSFSVSKKMWGTSVGAGIEYAITEKISARLKVDVITPNTYTTSDNLGDRFQIANNITQGTLGLNYKFD